MYFFSIFLQSIVLFLQPTKSIALSIQTQFLSKNNLLSFTQTQTMYTQIPLSNRPYRQNQHQSPNNHLTNKIITPKYCLNKTKKLQEFQNSRLFDNSSSARNLKQYSQRYTYNQRTNSFEKENIDCSLKHYDVDYSFVEGFKNQMIDKVPKIQILKKKASQLFHQNKESSVNKEKKSQVGLALKLNESVQMVYFKKKVQPQLIELKDVKSIQTRRLKISTNKYRKQFADKNSNQTLMSYIRSNPVNLAPIRLKQLRVEFRRKQDAACLMRKEIKHKQQTLVQMKKSSNEDENYLGKVANEEEQRQLQQNARLQEQLCYGIEVQVKKLYDMIEQLRRMGYTEEKVNQWVWGYCQNTKKFLQPILFKQQAQHSFISSSKFLHNLEDLQTCKTKARQFKRIINDHQIHLQIQDIEQLTIFLQQILISRQFLQLKRIQKQIEETSHAIKNNYLQMKNEKVDEILKMVQNFEEKKKLKPLDYYQMLNFYQDAKKIQDNFEKVKGLTIAGKRKYQNITNVQIELLRHKK